MNDGQRLASFWVWEKGLPGPLCDLLLKDELWDDVTAGTIGAIHDAPTGALNLEKRDSGVVFAPMNHWLEGVLYNFGLYAIERAGWNMSIGRPQRVQLTEYRPGQYYGLHSDTDFFTGDLNIRKVSVVALLSDPSEFEGGEFVFDDPNAPVPLVRGSVMAFPSLCQHQVKPVTAGVRRSAVCWITGPR